MLDTYLYNKFSPRQSQDDLGVVGVRWGADGPLHPLPPSPDCATASRGLNRTSKKSRKFLCILAYYLFSVNINRFSVNFNRFLNLCSYEKFKKNCKQKLICAEDFLFYRKNLFEINCIIQRAEILSGFADGRIEPGAIDNFRRGLHSLVRASAKTGLVAIHTVASIKTN